MKLNTAKNDRIEKLNYYLVEYIIRKRLQLLHFFYDSVLSFFTYFFHVRNYFSFLQFSLTLAQTQIKDKGEQQIENTVNKGKEQKEWGA